MFSISNLYNKEEQIPKVLLCVQTKMFLPTKVSFSLSLQLYFTVSGIIIYLRVSFLLLLLWVCCNSIQYIRVICFRFLTNLIFWNDTFGYPNYSNIYFKIILLYILKGLDFINVFCINITIPYTMDSRLLQHECMT